MSDKKHNHNKIIKIIIIIAMAAVIAAIGIYFSWKNGLLLPGWIKWEQQSLIDSANDIEITLKKRKVRVTTGDNKNVVWQSPKGVNVQSILYFDIDFDNENELILLCWKIGRYGKFKPIWVKEDEKKWSQHIFIYDCSKEKVKAIWMASDIGMDVISWHDTTDGNLSLTEPDGDVTLWRWLSWGLKRVG